jgi:hypothetical protein
MGGQGRWLAICSDEACGHVEVHAADLTASSDGLRTFLLGKRPIQAYVAPWVRFFVQVQRAYVTWAATGVPCLDCGRSLVMAIDIPWNPLRAGDPVQATLCLDCGAVMCEFWITGERTELHMSGEAWAELPVQLQALKRAIAERSAATNEHDDDPP